MQFCRSCLYLYSVHIPIAIANDENINAHIHLWNRCIPSSKKKLCHNG